MCALLQLSCIKIMVRAIAGSSNDDLSNIDMSLPSLGASLPLLSKALPFLREQSDELEGFKKEHTMVSVWVLLAHNRIN